MANAVILDTDLGTDIDDTWALGMLLASPEVSLEAVITAHADTPHRAAIVTKLLDTWGRADVPVGIGMRGADLERRPQAAYLDGYGVDDYPGSVVEDGIGLLIDKVMSTPEPILVAIGPATNIAAALAREPRIAERARFIGMHGSIRRGYRGSDDPQPEYNVFIDAEAFRAVLAAPWDITLTPLDTCGIVYLKDAKYAAVRDSEHAIAREVIANYRAWCEAVELGDRAERRSTTLYDTVAVLLAFGSTHLERYVEMEDVPIVVRDDGLTAETETGRVVHAAMGWRDLAGFEDLLVERIDAEPIAR